LTKSTLRRPSSVELGWKNFAVERRTTMPAEKPERTLDHHFLILWDAHVAEGEIAERSGRFAPYKKLPNTITACPPGIMRAFQMAMDEEGRFLALRLDILANLGASRPIWTGCAAGRRATIVGRDSGDCRELERA
jgi:hypothetical protein